MYINVIEAYYGQGSGINLVDVTNQAQGILEGVITSDKEIYVDPSTFSIPDPNQGVRKTFYIKYTTTTQSRFTSPPIVQLGIDSETITIQAAAAGIVYSKRAIYGSFQHNYDITEQFNRYLNIFPKTQEIESIGSASFLSKFCYGSDVDPYIPKSLFLHLTNSETATDMYLVGNDGQNLSWQGL